MGRLKVQSVKVVFTCVLFVNAVQRQSPLFILVDVSKQAKPRQGSGLVSVEGGRSADNHDGRLPVPPEWITRNCPTI